MSKTGPKRAQNGSGKTVSPCQGLLGEPKPKTTESGKFDWSNYFYWAHYKKIISNLEVGIFEILPLHVVWKKVRKYLIHMMNIRLYHMVLQKNMSKMNPNYEPLTLKLWFFSWVDYRGRRIRLIQGGQSSCTWVLGPLGYFVSFGTSNNMTNWQWWYFSCYYWPSD